MPGSEPGRKAGVLPYPDHVAAQMTDHVAAQMAVQLAVQELTVSMISA
jgi:hypothetical protein